MNTEQQFIKLMRQRRKACNITQKELAQRIRVDASNITKIELGQITPSLKMMRRIAKALNIQISITFTI